MKTSDFYYDLPEELIAQDPLEERSSSKLMVLDRLSGQIEHKIFKDILDELDLYLNNKAVCEITKYSKSGLCDKCVKESKRTVERPSREELKALIRSTPFTKIGEHFGVSDNTIRKWCKAEGLPSKVVDIKKYSVQEWEEL